MQSTTSATKDDSTGETIEDSVSDSETEKFPRSFNKQQAVHHSFSAQRKTSIQTLGNNMSSRTRSITPGQKKFKNEEDQVLKESQEFLNNQKLNWNLRKILNQKDFKNVVLQSNQYDDFEKMAYHIKKGKLTYISDSQTRKSHNHIENQWNLSNKKALFYNLRSYYEALKENPFEYIPLTFHIQKVIDNETALRSASPSARGRRSGGTSPNESKDKI